MKKLQIIIIASLISLSIFTFASMQAKGQEAPTVSVTPASVILDAGQSQTFKATASGGSGTYSSYQWYVGGTGQSGQTAKTYSYSPSASGTYLITVTVTDSLGATSVQSAAATVAVNVAPTATVSPASWSMDVGQSKTFTATPVGGSGSYTSYQWYVGGVAQSGKTASTFSYSPTSAATYSITVTVTDSLGTVSVQSVPATVTVSSTLVAPTASASAGTVNQGQTSTLSSTSVTTGTGPYTCQWLEKTPSATSYSAVSGATTSSYSFVTSGSTATGAYSFELQVTDSTSALATSSAVSVTVDTAALSQFVFSSLGDQTAGTPFSITITAENAYGNTITTYTGTNTLTVSTGTINPASTVAFSKGIWTGSVTVTGASQ